jgi:hypothetical protein
MWLAICQVRRSRAGLGRDYTRRRTRPAVDQLEVDRAIRRRLEQALNHPEYEWRSIGAVATEAGISEDRAADLLRSDERVRFSVGKTGNRIVGLISRVRPHR